jgi:hypothetical protein
MQKLVANFLGKNRWVYSAMSVHVSRVSMIMLMRVGFLIGMSMTKHIRNLSNLGLMAK